MTKIKDMVLGSVVAIGSIYDEPIEWIIGINTTIASDKIRSYPQNSVVLFNKNIITYKSFDAVSTGGIGAQYGNNNYAVSNIRQWSNSDADAGQWYTKQDSTDAPPESHLISASQPGYCVEPYVDAPGFLNAWSEEEKSLLLPWPDNNAPDILFDKVWLFNGENSYEYWTNTAGNSAFYFRTESSLAATPTASALKNRINTSNLQYGYYWRYTSYSTSGINYVYTVSPTGGTSNTAYTPVSDFGVRYKICIDGDTEFELHEDGVYYPVFNHEPGTPEHITITPATVVRNKDITVTWGEATDEDGEIESYILERKLVTEDEPIELEPDTDIDTESLEEDDEWEVLYQGDALEYTDRLTEQVDSVVYRVAAVDNEGALSEYLEATAIMAPNEVPVVEMGATNLGSIEDAPELTFTVTDADDPTVHVVVYFDETIVYEEEAFTVGDTFTLDLEWDTVENGYHFFEVHATDSQGAEAIGQTSFTKFVFEHIVTELDDVLVTSRGLETAFRIYHRNIVENMDANIKNYDSLEDAIADNPDPEDGIVVLINGEWYVSKGGTFVQQSAKVWYDERTPGQLYKSDEAPESLDVGKFDGCFYATRVYNAVWNDYAELMEAGEKIKAGHIAYIHDDGLLYATGNPGQAIGIVSDCYGHLLGGNGDPDEDGFVAISLAGRVPLKVKGNFKVGDYVYAGHDGIGVRNTFGLPGCIGRCVGKDPKKRKGYINVLVGGM